MIDPAPPTPFRHRLATLQAGVLLGGVGLLIVLAITAYLSLQTTYQRAVDRVLSDADRTAQKLAFRTSEVFDRVNQSTLLITHLANAGEVPPLQELQQGGVLAGEMTRAVFVSDAKGRVLDSTSDKVALNVADEDYFKTHQRVSDRDLLIGVAAPLPLADAWGIPVSRRLRAADGRFDGVVVAAVDPRALAAGYAQTEETDTVVGVLGLDGVYRSRGIGGKVSFGERVDPAVFEEHTRIVHTTRRPVRSPVDHVERFTSIAPVNRYPLLAVVAVNADSALAPYRHARQQLLAWAATLAGLIIVGVGLLHAKVQELQQSRAQTRRAEAAFRATLEGSLDAVTLMEARRDSLGKLIDMTVVDGNARAAAIVGMTREEMIGQSVCTLTPSIAPYLGRFEHAILSRQASHSEVQSTEPGIRGRWLHHQVVPFEDGVALISRDITDRKEAEAMLANLARLDALTQLGNRRDFEIRLHEAHLRAIRSHQTLALLFLDLDGFKRINDVHGHAAGDQVLVETARRLRECVRLTDSVHRLGGDEFTVILEAAGSPGNVADLCQRIVECLSRPHALADHRLVSTPSVGVALLEGDETVASLTERADAAMYEAKRAGKACHRFAPTAAPTVDTAS